MKKYVCIIKIVYILGPGLMQSQQDLSGILLSSGYDVSRKSYHKKRKIISKVQELISPYLSKLKIIIYGSFSLNIQLPLDCYNETTDIDMYIVAETEEDFFSVVNNILVEIQRVINHNIKKDKLTIRYSTSRVLNYDKSYSLFVNVDINGIRIFDFSYFTKKYKTDQCPRYTMYNCPFYFLNLHNHIQEVYYSISNLNFQINNLTINITSCQKLIGNGVVVEVSNYERMTDEVDQLVSNKDKHLMRWYKNCNYLITNQLYDNDVLIKLNFFIVKELLTLKKYNHFLLARSYMINYRIKKKSKILSYHNNSMLNTIVTRLQRFYRNIIKKYIRSIDSLIYYSSSMIQKIYRKRVTRKRYKILLNFFKVSILKCKKVDITPIVSRVISSILASVEENILILERKREEDYLETRKRDKRAIRRKRKKKKKKLARLSEFYAIPELDDSIATNNAMRTISTVVYSKFIMRDTMIKLRLKNIIELINKKIVCELLLVGAHKSFVDIRGSKVINTKMIYTLYIESEKIDEAFYTLMATYCCKYTYSSYYYSYFNKLVIQNIKSKCMSTLGLSLDRPDFDLSQIKFLYAIMKKRYNFYNRHSLLESQKLCCFNCLKLFNNETEKSRKIIITNSNVTYCSFKCYKGDEEFRCNYLTDIIIDKSDFYDETSLHNYEIYTAKYTVHQAIFDNITIFVYNLKDGRDDKDSDKIYDYYKEIIDTFKEKTCKSRCLMSRYLANGGEPKPYRQSGKLHNLILDEIKRCLGHFDELISKKKFETYDLLLEVCDTNRHIVKKTMNYYLHEYYKLTNYYYLRIPPSCCFNCHKTIDTSYFRRECKIDYCSEKCKEEFREREALICKSHLVYISAP